jgi:hypothetical protein
MLPFEDYDDVVDFISTFFYNGVLAIEKKDVE